MNLAEQLTYIYHNFESWHKIKLPYDESVEYHRRLLMQGNIITIIENDELKAYAEVWKINYEQLGRLFCDVPFFVYDENITDGNIAYINNLWFDPSYRTSLINEDLLKQFGEHFKDCTFMARKRNKYNESFKVYPMSRIGA